MYSHRGWSYSSSSTPTTMSAYRRRRLRLPHWPAVGPLPLAMVIVAAVAWYHFAFGGFVVHGIVLDGSTGQPIAAARVWSSRADTLSSSEGSFALDRVKPPEMLSFDAPGYRAQVLRVSTPFDPLTPSLEPIGVEIDAVDADTGQPVAAVFDAGASSSLGPGRIKVAPVLANQKFNLTADGYIPAETYYGGQDVLRVTMLPKLTGRVTNAVSGTSVPGARISVGSLTLNTDADGAYTLPHRPVEGVLQVLAPGFRRAQIDMSQRPGLDVQLQPNPVRATYMTYFAIGGEDYRQEMYRLLDTTELNAVVIDVKGDYGLLSYRSSVPLAEQIGANSAPTIDDLDGLLQNLNQHGAYVIVRIVVFKDNVLARNGARVGLDVGVKDRRTGNVWVDG